jgi:hypothetical protein
MVDAGSSPASYQGPSATLYATTDNANPTIAAPYNAAANFVAGSSPIVIEAVYANAQSGVPVTWSASGASAGTFNATSEFTNSGGHSFVLYTPSNTVGTSTATATVAESTALATPTGTISTIAAAPSVIVVTPTSGGSSTATNYIQGHTNFGTPSSVTSGTYAEVATTAISGTIQDSFGNTVGSGVTAQTCTITAFGGSFDVSNAPSSSDATVNCAAGAGGITNDDLYYQSGTYGSTGYVQMVMSGTYNTNIAFTAKGVSPTISTSAEDNSVVIGSETVTCAACTGLNVAAGSASGAASTIVLTYTLTNTQVGVPVTFIGHNLTELLTAPSGSFVGGTGISIHHLLGVTTVTDFANVTAISALNTAGTAAIATATYTIDPSLNSQVKFTVQVTAPTTATPSNTWTTVSFTSTYTTVSGSPSKLVVIGCFVSSCTSASTPITKTVAGQTDYLDVFLADYWGNVATNTGGQLQVALAISPSSAGSLSASSVYIKTSATDTAGSFGTITFVINSGVTGSISITATGLYSGSGSLTVVSPNPTVTVTSPSGTVGHTIYSNLAGVGYSGTAAASAGVYPAPTISSVSYTVDGGATQTASGTGTWSFVATLSNGLHTIAVWSTDSNKLTSASNSTTVLVDTTAPTITNPTVLSYAAGQAIQFTVVESEGDLGSVSATVNGTALPASQVAVTSGANNLGHSVTYTVSVTGLAASAGHYGIALTAKSLAGNSATGTTLVVKVTVALGESFVVSGTPSKGTLGSFTGVNVNYQNVGASSQNVVIFAVWQSSAGTVGIGTASATLAAGASTSAFIVEPVGLASGTYTVNIFVWTTSNQPVSVTTTITVTV